jgi:hypothetical protein
VALSGARDTAAVGSAGRVARGEAGEDGGVRRGTGGDVAGEGSGNR